ncbi:hypothetical protein HP532_05535 [Pseudomonas sp. CrR25]|nr:hypothetical protein [Pseudomonas sp. CrR25]
MIYMTPSLQNEAIEGRSYAKGLFSLAALFNWVAAIPFLIAPGTVANLLGIHPTPADPMFTDLFMVLVLAFGWGYWKISRDPRRNRPIIELGIFGKLLVVVVGYGYFFAGKITWPFAVLVTGDLLWAYLFWRFLRRYPANH